MEEQALLNKRYDENCSGCKVELAKVQGKDLSSFRNIFLIWIINFSAALATSSLYTYLYFMVKDFDIAHDEEDINTYAGYVGSAFMVGRAMTAVVWGNLSDRFGRKPIVIIGFISMIIFNTLFGFSTNIWIAVTYRFLLGFLNGLVGPMRAFASEIFRQDRQGLGLKHASAAPGVGTVVGAAWGGYFAQPVQKYPTLFPKDSIWDKFPYLLPNLVISAIAIAALIIAYIWLPETLHNRNCSYKESGDKVEAEEEVGGSEIAVEKGTDIFYNRQLLLYTFVYCLFSLNDISYQEVFSLWAVSPERLGGLNFTTNRVGTVLSISGLAIVVYQLTLYALAQKACGLINLSKIAGALTMPLQQVHPFIAALVSGSTQLVLVTIAFLLKSLMSDTLSSNLTILANGTVEQSQRGMANGFMLTAMSVFKIIGPIGGGAVLAWSQRRLHASFLPGTHMVFLILNVIEGVGLLFLFEPFLGLRKNSMNQLQ